MGFHSSSFDDWGPRCLVFTPRLSSQRKLSRIMELSLGKKKWQKSLNPHFFAMKKPWFFRLYMGLPLYHPFAIGFFPISDYRNPKSLCLKFPGLMDSTWWIIYINIFLHSSWEGSDSRGRHLVFLRNLWPVWISDIFQLCHQCVSKLCALPLQSI